MSGWDWDPAVLVPLVAVGGLYAAGLARLWGRAGIGRGVRWWQAASFAAGWVTLWGALVSPLHEWGEHLFVAHMVEHEALMTIAAPLLVLSRPLGTFLHVLPARKTLVGAARTIAPAWRILMVPAFATALHAVAIWTWHIPRLLDATVENEAMHRLQHISFLGTALIFWWAILRRPRRTYGEGALHVFVTMVHTGLLGALLTLAPHVLYPLQTAGAPAVGLTPLEDQQLAGLFMWVPGGAVYLLTGLALGWLWLAQEGSHARGYQTWSPQAEGD